MRKNRWLTLCLVGCLLLSLCACGAKDESAQMDDPATGNTQTKEPTSEQIQYDYQLKAGELTEVYDVTFDQMVTVTVDPASTRDGGLELRSEIYFDNCTFNAGLTIVGDYHAMITLGSGCTFADGSVVTCEAVNAEEVKGTVLEDNLLKVLVSCEGVQVNTESPIGVICEGPDVVLNDTTYSKDELAPDTAFLGVYTLYEDDTMTYVKLAIGEDDSVEFLD